jgi:hypothetical protein
VQVEDLEPPAAALAFDDDGGVLAAAALPQADGQVDVALAQDRMPAQGGVAVAALPQRHVVPNRHVRVAEPRGQLTREVHLPRSGHALVHLLQEDDVRLVTLEDAGDPLGTEKPVDTDRAVDVVGQHAKAHQGGGAPTAA